MAVVAHPDDAELLCAGTLARAKADGAAIAVCVLCRGDKGQPRKKLAKLSAVRRKEAACAASLLGARVFWAGFADGTLADGPAQRSKLIEVFRQFRPTLVFAHAPSDYHPDHRAASQLAEAASWFCASRGHSTCSPAMRTQPALWWMDTLGMTDFNPGFHIDITKQVPIKEQMLACHHSQLSRGRDPDFSDLTQLMRRQYRTRGLQAGVAAAEAFCAHVAFRRLGAF